MNFDPDHPKWNFCCCHVRTGLMILAGSEIVLSLLISLCIIIYVATADSKKYDSIPWFVMILIPVFITYCISSACLFFGVYKYKRRFMYPTVVTRVVLALVAHITSGSIIVRSAGGNNDVNSESLEDQNLTKNDIGPNLTELVLLLIIFLFLLLLFIFDTVRSTLLCSQIERKLLLFSHRSSTVSIKEALMIAICVKRRVVEFIPSLFTTCPDEEYNGLNLTGSAQHAA
ncbi:unnamed protein product [Onchocerca ochengi]|uniref:DUF7027 domain-containing protein n=1 Tax=Onchocerca ochengi TaxID=42157 RepID=A0A182EHQ9_ONCOC|nr:unnamed protein product [Onchocerca ochengi]